MRKFYILVLALIMVWPADAQRRRNKNNEPEKAAATKIGLNGLKFRSVGPALTSGRISDIAVNPKKPKEYYVATSSGGVWYTNNSGTTYKPIFDTQGSYSIGCITIDPNNPETIWVGTGENNNQRSVAYGDGVYKSEDGGKSWEHVGLKTSEHIGNILVHPENSDIVWVSAIGPLWSSGGERGVYKTTDGGKTWRAVLTIDEHTGVNEVVAHPDNPDVLYASTYQRRRHVFTYVGGGPGSAIYKSEDGGESWEKKTSGLPDVDLGRIGLAIPASNPGIVYAIVEAADNKGGFFKSTNGGARWEKMGGYSSSGNYYQEIMVDPNDENTIYAMNTWMQVSEDGGKSFNNVGEDFKHVDNHSIWINPQDREHLLVGCDGGIYETFDRGATWIFKANLPVTQFYKVTVDNSEPFYYIYGGTQDNFSLGGPSRTVSGNGIANSEWFVTHGGDGFESAVDPENPNIVYAQSQYGVLVRYDRKSGEELLIQPMPRKGEDQYRWNWDAPLEVSYHKPGRLYFAANKVFRSDDRGQSWEVISDDLTAQINRNELKVMGKVQSIDAVAKNGSTSPYGTIVALSESMKDENLLVIGTDDGLIQITRDGGNSWQQASNVTGVPARSYVNEVVASKHDVNVLYAAFNRHKEGDFKPYIYKSTNGGQSWNSIIGDLPARGSVYAIEEDPIDKNLVFVGTEFGVFFTTNGGNNWMQLKAGVPTIAVRDIAIHPRENDLILGTFGRGFYVLDDYSALRSYSGLESKEAELFPIRDSWSFEYRYPLGLPKQGFQGDDYYLGENLGSFALFTYYLKEKPESLKSQRQKREKDTADDRYPSYDELKAEREEDDAYLLFSIKNAQGDIIRKLKASPAEGINRLKWDLRTAPTSAINLNKSSFYNPFAGNDEGHIVAPGEYTVSMAMVKGTEVTALGTAQSFAVKALNNKVLPAEDMQAMVEFKDEVAELNRQMEGVNRILQDVGNELKHIDAAIIKTPGDTKELIDMYKAVDDKLAEIRVQLNGDPVKRRLDIDQPMSPASRLGMVGYGAMKSNSTPTTTHKESIAIAREEFTPILESVRKLVRGDLKQLQDKLESAGAPYTPNRILVQ